jgi:spore germination protein KC
MKKGQRLLIYFLLISIPLFLSGCWDSRELNDISIIAGIGWDKDPVTGETTLTYQSIIPSQIKGSAGAEGNGSPKAKNNLQAVQINHSSGFSGYEALNRLTQHISRVPFYQHTLVLVFGKDTVRQGIYSYIDIIVRNPGSRPDNLIVVAKNKTSDILAAEDGLESIQAVGMAKEIKLSASFTKYPAITLLEFVNRLMSETTAPIAPIIGIKEENGPEGQKTKKICIKGTAVFKGDKMIGELNERESSGLLWVTNEVKKGYVPTSEANFEIVNSKTKIIPQLQGDKVIITIEINENSNLVLYEKHKDLTFDTLRDLEESQSKEIKGLVMEAVEKSFSLNADIFGFGEVIHRKYKREWQEMKSNWDKVYPNIEINVKVTSHLNETGDINKSLLKD